MSKEGWAVYPFQPMFFHGRSQPECTIGQQAAGFRDLRRRSGFYHLKNPI
jgi:hypothetical protein